MLKRGVIGDLSGKIGQIIIRRVKGGKVFAVTPAIVTKPRSKLQLESQTRFAKATRYARQTMVRRPEVWKVYQGKVNGPYMSANNIAIRDFMSPPTIDDIHLTDYHGRKGEPIYIEAHDKVRVARVTVRIISVNSGDDGDGDCGESGCDNVNSINSNSISEKEGDEKSVENELERGEAVAVYQRREWRYTAKKEPFKGDTKSCSLKVEVTAWDLAGNEVSKVVEVELEEE